MPVSADAESRVVVAMCTAAAGSPAAVYRTFCLFHRMSCVAGLATSQWRRITADDTCRKFCQVAGTSGPDPGLSAVTVVRTFPDRGAVTVAVSADSGPFVTTHTCVTIRRSAAHQREVAHISSFAGPQATQLVAQATADCPPLRSADCAPLYQASSPSRSQVTQASAQQPCVRAPPIKPPIQPATSSSAHSR